MAAALLLPILAIATLLVAAGEEALGPSPAGQLRGPVGAEAFLGGEDIEADWRRLQGSRRRLSPTASSGSRRRSSGTGKKSSDDDGGGTFTNFIIGVLLWCLVPAFLWNNERIAIKQSKLQGKARRVVLVEDAKREPIEDLEGHIVFVTDISKCEETLQDAYFPEVRSLNCVKLQRHVEMYQWRQNEEENEDSDGNKYKTYTYEKVWSNSPENIAHSSQYSNPPMPLPSSTAGTVHRLMQLRTGAGEPCAEAPEGSVRLGTYYLGDLVRRELSNWHDKSVDEGQLRSCTASAELAKRGSPRRSGLWWLYGTGHEVGDVRVRFEELQCGPLSVCGVLARTARGWTFVPVISEEGTQAESCAAELGCINRPLPCCREKPMVFSSSEADDEELLELLGKMSLEITPDQQRQFRLLKDTKQAGFYEAGPEDEGFCCTCLVSKKTISKCMAFLGLEEEFLGVKEATTTHEEMMHEEGKAANSRHCAARIIGIILGFVASLLILSPITTFLNSNWLIFLLGGGLVSCLLQSAACMLSLIVTTVTISLAWFRHRPRLVTLLITSLACGYLAVAGLGVKHRAGQPPTPAPVVPGGLTPVPAPAPSAGACASFGDCPPGMVGNSAAHCAAQPCTWQECCETAASCGSFGDCPPSMDKKASSSTCAGKFCTWQECCLQHTGI